MNFVYCIIMQADVYVNSTTSDLDLTNGQVSVALSKAAGPSLAQECSRKATIGRRLPGEITVTEGGNLKCKHVFHVVLKHYQALKLEVDEVQLPHACCAQLISKKNT